MARMLLAPLLSLGDVVGTAEILRVASQPTRLALRVTGLAAFGLLTETLALAITPIREEDLVAVLADTFGYNAAHPAQSSKPTRIREENPHRNKTKHTPDEQGRRQSLWNGGGRKRLGRKPIFRPAVSEENHFAAVTHRSCDTLCWKRDIKALKFRCFL